MRKVSYQVKRHKYHILQDHTPDHVHYLLDVGHVGDFGYTVIATEGEQTPSDTGSERGRAHK